jgi:hypothetical protein
MIVRFGWGAIAVTSLLLTSHASAELFRCEGPDGQAIYTDQKDTCPGAKAFEPSGVVHTAVTPSTPARTPDATTPTDRRSLRADPDAAKAASWKQKKRDAERDVANIEARREWMRPYVGHCNRGGYVTTRDDAGIQQVVNCSELRHEFASLEAKEAAAREYLEVGLIEDCRKAGCLPGWLR